MSIAAKFVLLLTLTQPVTEKVSLGDGSVIQFVAPKTSEIEVRRFENPADCNSAALSIIGNGGEARCVEVDANGNVVRNPVGDVIYIAPRREPDLVIRVESR